MFLKHRTKLTDSNSYCGSQSIFTPPVNTDSMLIPRIACLCSLVFVCLCSIGSLLHGQLNLSVCCSEWPCSPSCFYPPVSPFNIRGKAKQQGGCSRRQPQTGDRLSIGKPDALTTLRHCKYSTRDARVTSQLTSVRNQVR